MLNVDFHPAELIDKNWVNTLLKDKIFFNSEFGFGNMFIWSDAFKTQIGRYKDFLMMRSVSDVDPVYSFPIGCGDLKDAVDFLIRKSNDENRKLKFFNATEEVVSFLDENYHGLFSVKQRREVSDYIYRTEDLINLSGKKYHQKRNHISAFAKKYSWTFETMDNSNLDECAEMYEKWIEVKDARNDEEYIEYDAVMKALNNFSALSFIGGILRVDGRVIAFTLGEALNDKVFCTHIEKADVSFSGSYAMINNQFAANCLNGFEFVNREEDMGIEGLRKSKLSYHPCFLLDKNLAVYGENDD